MKTKPFERFCCRDNEKPLKTVREIIRVNLDHRAKATVLMRSLRDAGHARKTTLKESIYSGMNNKEIVEDLLQRLPDGASLHEIAQKIEFVAAVRQGLSELDCGERTPIEEVERELPSWIVR